MAKLDLGTLYFNVDAQLKNVVKSLNDVKKYNSGLKNVEDQTKKVVVENKKLSNSLNGVSNSLVKASLQAFGIYQALQFVKKAIVKTIKAADEFDLLNDRLKIATKLTEDYVQVQHELLKIGRETGASLKVNVGLFQNFARSAPDLQATNQEMLTLISSVNKIAAVSGASATDLKFALRQFSQAMAAGIVRAEEFNSIVENTPELATKIASGMGMTVGKLRLAVLEGNVLSKDVFQTLLKQTDEINSEFEEMPVRTGRAWGIFKNELQITIGRLNEQLGITDKIVRSLGFVSGILEKNNKLAEGSIAPERLKFLEKEIKFLEQRKSLMPFLGKKDRENLKAYKEEYEKLQNIINKDAGDVSGTKPIDSGQNEKLLEQNIAINRRRLEIEFEYNQLSLDAAQKLAVAKIELERKILEATLKDNIVQGDEKEILADRLIAIEEELLEKKKELIEKEQAIRDRADSQQFINARKLAEAKLKMQKENQAAASDFIIGNTRDVLQQTSEYSKTAFELNKAFALADIAVKTSQAIMAALTVPPPVGPALAIAAGAAGAAQAALVTSQTFSGKEGGGMVGANSMYRVNEAGPEMFSVGGKDYLMTGSMGGNITPNDKISTSTGSSNFPKVTVNIITPEGTEARVEQNQQGDELQINAIIERLDKATAQGIRSGLSDTSSALSETFGLNRGVSAF